MSFDVQKHLMKLKDKDYLPVAARLIWYRDEHPDWSVITEIVELDDAHAVFRASVLNTDGRIIGTGTKLETKGGFADYVEKAETGAIGRALALCGYGTQFAPELEEGERIVDSPQEPKQAQAKPQGAAGTITDKQIGLIHSLAKEVFGETKEAVEAYKQWLVKETGKSSSKALTMKQASEVIEKLTILRDERKEKAA